MDISIIIINYNTKNLTLNCINSIFNHTKDISFEVILFDNASTDGSKELFENDKRIIYIYSEVNLGFGKANNIAFQHTKGKYIFLLNSDTLLLNNALYYFYAAGKSYKNWGCLGAQLLNVELGLSPSFGYFLTISNILKEALLSYIRILRPINPVVTYVGNNVKEVQVIIGADLYISRETIMRYGLFDSQYFMYHEENDMQRRYSIYGLKQYIIPGPQIIHFESQSTKVSFNKRIMSTNSLFIYVKKWNYKSQYYIFRFIYFFLKLPYIFSYKLNFKQRISFFKLLTKTC